MLTHIEALSFIHGIADLADEDVFDLRCALKLRHHARKLLRVDGSSEALQGVTGTVPVQLNLSLD